MRARTANGEVRTAFVRLDEVRLGDATDRDVAALKILMGNMFEIPKGKSIVQFTVFRKRFLIIRSLHTVEHQIAAIVCSGQQVAMSIKIEPPHVCATFREQFELFCFRVVSPQPLLEFVPADVCRDIRTLRSIQPAVRSPDK